MPWFLGVWNSPSSVCSKLGNCFITKSNYLDKALSGKTLVIYKNIFFIIVYKNNLKTFKFCVVMTTDKALSD